MQRKVMDVVVVGGGIVGTAILRKLSFYDLTVALVEKQPDVCEGASKANSGIIHTGFDAKPQTVEAECLRRSRELWPDLVSQLKIPYISCGAVMVATSEEEREIIFSTYVPNAQANGVEVHWMEVEELREMNPAVSDQALGGLVISDEAICDPFWATRANAELAVLNGAEVLLGVGVQRIEQEDDHLRLVLDDGGEILTRYVVNAAGLWADEIARMIGDDSFTLTPRKGQFLLTEEQVDITQIILPVPTKISKGVLISPVVFGGFLLGPTAEDQEDKWDRSTTSEGLTFVSEGCSKLVPQTQNMSTIRQFAGLRAVCSEGDFVIRPSSQNQRMVHAAGIRSTGVSASPGIAELVVEKLEQAGLMLDPKSDPTLELPELFGEADGSETGEIICLCRSISRGELLGALSRPIRCTTVDGLKRRTGATLGECQGNCCIPKIMDLLAEQSAMGPEQPLKGLRHSHVAMRGAK
ncbi:NAD(P)/FAD-dependent oxidoreductase [Brevibacillus choshinensis]|uniref:NAD(P)/FAD-dependent oxidoreductase n=1 Tax=Brevibacillus choshinensis TaxID=54911 RepID=UPI002E2110E8|nr:NAD(P)/FAD-dependent oxidoreductase [Brevibacillus choshinensis]